MNRNYCSGCVKNASGMQCPEMKTARLELRYAIPIRKSKGHPDPIEGDIGIFPSCKSELYRLFVTPLGESPIGESSLGIPKELDQGSSL